MISLVKDAWHDIKYCMALLTRIPVELDENTLGQRRAAATWAFPVVGVMIASLSVLVCYGATLYLSPTIAVCLLLLTSIYLTGALHEDGLADCADGFWGGRYRKKRLRIMKDSATGVYGTLALILFVTLRAVCYFEIIGSGHLLALIPIIATSRLWMTLAMGLVPSAKEDGIGHAVGKPDSVTMATASLLAITVALIVSPIALLACLAGGIGAALAADLARKKIGGYTGDVLGAIQQMAEVTALIFFIALA